MAVETFIAHVGVSSNVGAAKADYEAVHDLYAEAES